MRLSATEVDWGWRNSTRPSELTLKLCQLRMARSVACSTRSVLPETVAPAWPDCTKPGLCAPHEPAMHGTGSSAARAASAHARCSRHPPVSARNRCRDIPVLPVHAREEQQARVADPGARPRHEWIGPRE